MTIDLKPRKLGADRLRGIKPKSVDLSEAKLVESGPLQPGRNLLLLVRPAVEGLDLSAWLGDHRELVERWLLEHGGILFRGFGIRTVPLFERFTHTLSADLLEYKERSTPRTELAGRIYTSTEYPAHQSITFHNEFSYALTWPMKITFCCITASEQGGETPLADSAEVYRLLDPALREPFEKKGVMYVRNYGGGIDLSWQDAFQTTDRTNVEEYCRQAPMDFEWRDGDRLRTRSVRPAVARHAVSGENLWFNQAHLFHVSNLDPSMRQAMLSAFAEEDLPRNTLYGDGSRIDPAALDAVRAAYAEAEIVFPWEEGDVALLDNMRVAHGRRPYVGERKIVVGMMQPYGEQARDGAASGRTT
jgi:alpha-ketoglutarate-dependent taurine dioxygenase